MPIKIEQHPEKEDKFLVSVNVGQPKEYDKVKPDISTIFQHTDRPVAVLGGGPSLPEDLKLIPKDSILISCNHHAFRLVDPDYMVFLDPPGNNHSDEYRQRIKEAEGKRISVALIDLTDYYCINEDPWYQTSDTGMFGTWVACYISSGPVYLCGMGLRHIDEPVHFYDDGHSSAWGGSAFEVKVKRWKEAFDKCHNPERIKAVSGPLINIFL